LRKLTDFLMHSGIVPDRDYFRDAMAQRVEKFAPPERRNFFQQTIAREPLGLFSHDYHWIELARMKEEPNRSAIRRLPALYNMLTAAPRPRHSDGGTLMQADSMTTTQGVGKSSGSCWLTAPHVVWRRSTCKRIK